MPIISQPNTYINRYDPKTGTREFRRLIINSPRRAGVWFDGRYIWITNITTLTANPYNMETNTFGTAAAVSQNPVAIWGDGRILYTISSAGSLRQHDLSTGTLINATTLIGAVYLGLTGDSRYIWALTTANVLQFDRATYTLIGTFAAPSNASDIHFDGRFMWILTGADSVQGTIKQYDPSTGTQIGSFNVTNYGIISGPYCLCGDGRYLYITEAVL